MKTAIQFQPLSVSLILQESLLKELGLDKVVLDDKCFVYGILAATPGYENKKKLGLIAHMDTVPEFCEAEIHPVCTPDYDGCDLVLGDSGRVLTTKDFPHLKGLKGRTLITSDGNTILGVDDKAGIAEIMQLLEILITEKIPHGQISVAFTPDEECGSGAAHFDFDTFDAELPIRWTGTAKARSSIRTSMHAKQNLRSMAKMYIRVLQKM